MKANGLERWGVVVLAAGTLALHWLLAPSAAAAEDRIVIEAKALRPAIVETTVGDRVTFVNRSGRVVHVEFIGTSSEHRVFQNPREIWAEFHLTGRHEYMVHLSGGGRATELRGTVVVHEDPSARTAPRECNGFVTVMGVCLER
jgi:plastocyanin